MATNRIKLQIKLTWLQCLQIIYDAYAKEVCKLSKVFTVPLFILAMPILILRLAILRWQGKHIYEIDAEISGKVAGDE